ncbi:MAG: M15 family metallopeptidase [Candidatus Aminicenantaceae bacterium]
MKRRNFLKLITKGAILGLFAPKALAAVSKTSPATSWEKHDDHIKDYLHKMRNFNRHYEGDIYLDGKQYRLLKSAVKRLYRLQRTVGHGNFYLLNFDDAIKVARNYSQVDRFPERELDFMEMIFYEDGGLYGFFGEKPLKNLTDRIKRREVFKVPHTGNYLYKGVPSETYTKLKQDVGHQLILTSGVRSIMKQFLLFLNKAYTSRGNLSVASRSLAPPGYSLHGVGDFDVGQVGFGIANFSSRFTTTKVFKRLRDFGYIKLRYPKGNLLGVRFEPWHIKVN